MDTINRIYSRKLEIYFHKNHENDVSLISHNHHVIKVSRVITLDKLAPVEIYSILISKVQNKPSSNIYFENLLIC